MISLLVKLSRFLKPYQKLTYLLALFIVVHLGYQVFNSTPDDSFHFKKEALSLVMLAWLTLLNLMLNLFIHYPEKVVKQSVLSRIKANLIQWAYYFLFIIFISLSIILIILTFKVVGL